MGRKEKATMTSHESKTIITHLVTMVVNCHKSNGWDGVHSFHPWAWFLENMREYTGFKPVAPKAMGEPKMCVNNAFRAVGRATDYVEGYIVLDFGFPTVHAWNVTDGVPVDYTLPDPGEYAYWGVPIPNDLMVMCAEHRAWTLCTGCFEVMCMMSASELAKAMEILKAEATEKTALARAYDILLSD